MGTAALNRGASVEADIQWLTLVVPWPLTPISERWISAEQTIVRLVMLHAVSDRHNGAVRAMEEIPTHLS